MAATVVVATTTAYAGSTSTTYSCKAPVIGLVSVTASVSETGSPIGSAAAGTTFTTTATVSATIPGSLLDDAAAAGLHQISLTAATLTVDGNLVASPTGATSQQTEPASGQLPIVIPIPSSSGNAAATVSLTMNPQPWVAGPATGAASLTPGELDLDALLSFPCYTPGPQAQSIGGPSGPAVQPMDFFAVTGGSTTTPGGTASGGPQVFLSSSTGLINQQTIAVTGVGFAGGKAGTILECNLAPDQPLYTAMTPAQPVGCTPAGGGSFTVNPDGSITFMHFRINTGNQGAWETSLDSRGTSAPVDAASYPCPPTPAQQKAGITCGIVVSDASGNRATVPISLTNSGPAPPGEFSVPAPGGGTVPTSGSSGAITPQSLTQQLAAPAGSGGAGGGPRATTLAINGVGSPLWLTGIVGVVLLALGYLVLTIYRRPRRLLADAWHSLARAFGAGSAPS
ncbi:MAG: hypothetical protein ACYCVS_08820 [Acidimicrobiales bacterium]